MSFSLQRMAFSGLSLSIVVAIIGTYFLIPLKDNVSFGIDLVGGTYITLKVQAEKAVESELYARLSGIPDKLKAENVELPASQVVEGGAIVLTFETPMAAKYAASAIKSMEKELELTLSDKVVRLQFTDAKVNRIRDHAVQSNIEVLRSRLDKLGVAEISIAAQGDQGIVIELPNVEDPQQAKAMIGKTAILEFKIVERVGKTPEDILLEYDGDMPDGMQVYPSRDGKTHFLLPIYTDITGSSLKDASAGLGGQMGSDVVVKFSFTSEGGDKFYDLTSKYYGRELAVVLDGVVITAATIKAKIRDDGEISGSYTPEKANELAMLLKSGAFVAPVTFEEEQQIGPSLGAESIKQGFVSCLVGLGLLFVFSLFYYSLSGLFAFIALLYNLFLILLTLSYLGATLTLPGIAGMVLTVGMAIDASILIFERIKEELASGLTLKRAVDAGFSNAMGVILDANITTFVVGVVLYKFGTGPIKGFAATMMIGIISTLITGLFFLRSLFNFWLDNFKVKKLRI